MGVIRGATLVSSISRSSGGLFQSVRQLNHAVSDCGADTRVFSLRDKYTDADRSAWDGADLTVCDVHGPGAFGFSPDLKREVFKWHAEVIHLHGLWMYPSVVTLQTVQRYGVPSVVSPRGMLDPWALSNSAWKKKTAGHLFENRNLRSAACIHALCESEYRSIRAYGLTNPVCVIPNGVHLPDLPAEPPAPPWVGQVPAGKKVMLFLGRIHPKKGLENLIRAWGILKAGTSPQFEQWHLVIAGWSQGGHEDELKRLVHELGLETNVVFAGPLYDTAKDAALRAANAFILPSFSEGLPMSVLEAWSYSLPVVMTAECNIPDGFATGAAVEVRPEVGSVAEGLKSFFSLPGPERRAMGLKGRSLVETRFSWPRIAADMVGVYEWVLGQGPEPESVRLA